MLSSSGQMVMVRRLVVGRGHGALRCTTGRGTAADASGGPANGDVSRPATYEARGKVAAAMARHEDELLCMVRERACQVDRQHRREAML